MYKSLRLLSLGKDLQNLTLTFLYQVLSFLERSRAVSVDSDIHMFVELQQRKGLLLMGVVKWGLRHSDPVSASACWEWAFCASEGAIGARTTTTNSQRVVQAGKGLRKSFI